MTEQIQPNREALIEFLSNQKNLSTLESISKKQNSSLLKTIAKTLRSMFEGELGPDFTATSIVSHSLRGGEYLTVTNIINKHLQ